MNLNISYNDMLVLIDQMSRADRLQLWCHLDEMLKEGEK